MKEHKTIAGKIYTVTSPNGCTVTDETGLQLGTVEAGEQKVFTATGGAMWLDDTAARVTANFNQAPVKLKLLGLLGGGVSTSLPSGYLAAEFLESTGTQYVRLPQLEVNNNDTIKSEFVLLRYKDASANGMFAIFGYDAGQHLRIYTTKNTNAEGRFIAYKFGDAGVSMYVPEGKVIKWDITKDGCVVNGVQYDKLNTLDFSYSDMLLFNQYVNAKYWPAILRFYKFSVSQKCNLRPSLDSNGVPCMYDKVTKQPFYNKGSGSFIIGMTIAQARQLSKLPSTGGNLTVSLPSNYLEDDGVVNALATAQENGWKITIQPYEAEAGAASTFALRRIWVRKDENEQGSYVDSDGTRWQVEWCVDIVGSSPEAEGYEPFRSVDVAVNYWGLTPWVDPEAEELLTNTEEV